MTRSGGIRLELRSTGTLDRPIAPPHVWSNEQRRRGWNVCILKGKSFREGNKVPVWLAELSSIGITNAIRPESVLSGEHNLTWQLFLLLLPMSMTLSNQSVWIKESTAIDKLSIWAALRGLRSAWLKEHVCGRPRSSVGVGRPKKTILLRCNQFSNNSLGGIP